MRPLMELIGDAAGAEPVRHPLHLRLLGHVGLVPPPLVRRDVLRRHVALVLGQAAIPTLEGVLELLERGDEGCVLGS